MIARSISRNIVVVVVLCLSVGGVARTFGQTVMVHVDVVVPGGAGSPGEKLAQQKSLLQASLQDGIMGVLFDAGMIVFSSELSGASSTSTGGNDSGGQPGSAAAEMQALYALQNQARNGGADRLVEVSVTAQVADSGSQLQTETAKFSLYSLSPRKIIVTGDAVASQFRRAKDEAEDSVARAMGRAIGERLVSSGTGS